MTILQDCADLLFRAVDDQNNPNPFAFVTHRPEFITLTPPLHFARDEVKILIINLLGYFLEWFLKKVCFSLSGQTQ